MTSIITKSTRVVNIGHLPGHVVGKTLALRSRGWTDLVSVVHTDHTVPGIKQLLRDSPGAICLMGGAMPKLLPDLVQELEAFVKEECPSIHYCQLRLTDFPPDIKMPPTEEDVIAASVKLLESMLTQQ